MTSSCSRSVVRQGRGCARHSRRRIGFHLCPHSGVHSHAAPSRPSHPPLTKRAQLQVQSAMNLLRLPSESPVPRSLWFSLQAGVAMPQWVPRAVREPGPEPGCQVHMTNQGHPLSGQSSFLITSLPLRTRRPEQGINPQNLNFNSAFCEQPPQGVLSDPLPSGRVMTGQLERVCPVSWHQQLWPGGRVFTEHLGANP